MLLFSAKLNGRDARGYHRVDFLYRWAWKYRTDVERKRRRQLEKGHNSKTKVGVDNWALHRTYPWRYVLKFGPLERKIGPLNRN